jgi:hypothetical protein
MMHFDLKPISREAIPAALERAHRYRLLNEPWQAESICEDVLRIEPSNQTALVTLLLAITDQFDLQLSQRRARDVLTLMSGDYERAYYAGIISERSARARVRQRLPGANFAAYDEIVQAMRSYEIAETFRPEGNDEAVWRWNTCARMLSRNHDLRPEPQEVVQPLLED